VDEGARNWANGLAPYIMHHHNSVPGGLLTATVYFAMRTMPSISGHPGLFEDPSTPLLTTICGRKSRLGTSIDRAKIFVLSN
jgi:hypothetical protein